MGGYMVLPARYIEHGFTLSTARSDQSLGLRGFPIYNGRP